MAISMHACMPVALTRNNDVTRRARGYSGHAVIPGPEYQELD